MKTIGEAAMKMHGRLLGSQENLAAAGMTVIGAIILLFFAMGKTYPPSAFLAAFTVLVAALLLMPLIRRLSREEGQ